MWKHKLSKFSTLLLVFLRVVPFSTCLGVSMMTAMSGSVLGQRESRMTTTDIKVRGERLNSAIRNEYERLMAAKALSWQRSHNIDWIIVQYIPIGASFEDAEKVLRAARFDLMPSPPRVPHQGDFPGDEFNILGSLTLEEFSAGRSWATVAIVPAKPGDPKTVVKEAHAGTSMAFL
jgi:hypothetical protein